MMAYLWPCCLKGEKFTKIKATQAQMGQALDVNKLFTNLELKKCTHDNGKVADKPGWLVPPKEEFASGQRENLIMDMLIRTQSVQESIVVQMKENAKDNKTARYKADDQFLEFESESGR